MRDARPESTFIERLMSSSVPVRIAGLDARALYCTRRACVRLVYPDFRGDVAAAHFFHAIATGDVQLVTEYERALTTAQRQEATA